MSLTTCIKKAGTSLSAADKSAIVKLARKYRAEGMKPDDAGRAAIREQISEVKSLLKQAIENPVSVDTFVEPVQKTAEPVQVAAPSPDPVEAAIASPAPAPAPIAAPEPIAQQPEPIEQPVAEALSVEPVAKVEPEPVVRADQPKPDATQPRPAQLIEMRKREAVLKKLKECIAS